MLIELKKLAEKIGKIIHYLHMSECYDNIYL